MEGEEGGGIVSVSSYNTVNLEAFPMATVKGIPWQQ